MSAPKRIQLRRTKGWRKPAGAIVVARPGPWGNPFRVGAAGGPKKCVLLYRALITGRIAIGTAPTDLHDEQLKVQLHVSHNLHTLRGHDLACWCALDAPCHADVLLELANGGDT